MDLEQLGREAAKADFYRGTRLNKKEMFEKVDEYKLGYISALCEYVCNHPDPLFCLEQLREIQAIYDFPFAQKIISPRLHHLNNCINA